jgi:hypothetical protein
MDYLRIVAADCDADEMLTEVDRVLVALSQRVDQLGARLGVLGIQVAALENRTAGEGPRAAAACARCDHPRSDGSTAGP